MIQAQIAQVVRLESGAISRIHKLPVLAGSLALRHLISTTHSRLPVSFHAETNPPGGTLATTARRAAGKRRYRDRPRSTAGRPAVAPSQAGETRIGGRDR